jgi:hypothetical protein
MTGKFGGPDCQVLCSKLEKLPFVERQLSSFESQYGRFSSALVG